MTTPDLATAFAANYREARAKFLAAARGAGARITSHVHPQHRGAEGEELAADIAFLGNDDADAVLCILAGTHGVEGFCGSGIQVGLLGDPAFHAARARAKVAVLLYHAVNPYGFSHLQRTDEGNVDLNRNFRDFTRPPPRNDAYAGVHDFIVPATWPPAPENEARLQDYALRHGVAALQAAITGGQCDQPQGLFFGGTKPAWGNVTLRAAMQAQATRARLGWLDIHTGLGPWGHAEKILSGTDDAAHLARARAWWGNDVTSIYDGSSASALITGGNFMALLEECPHTQYTGVALEYGTLPLTDMIMALRGDAWLQQHPDAPGATRDAIKQRMRTAFYGDTDEWRGQVYGQARAAAFQALRGLAPSA